MLNYISEIRFCQKSEKDSKISSPQSSPERSHSSNDDWMYSFDTFPRYRSEDELDTDDPFWKFMDETKYHCEEEESEDESGGNEEEEEESDTKDEHCQNMDDESDYDSDDEND